MPSLDFRLTIASPTTYEVYIDNVLQVTIIDTASSGFIVLQLNTNPPSINYNDGGDQNLPNGNDLFGDCVAINVDALGTTAVLSTILVIDSNGDAGFIPISSTGDVGSFLDNGGGDVPFPPSSTLNCCVHEDALVHTKNGLMAIKDICGSNHQVLTSDGEYVDLLYNIKHFPNEKEFYVIRKDHFSLGVPDKDLYLTTDHPVLVDGKEIVVNDLEDVEHVTLDKRVFTYTPCLENRCAIIIDNMPVFCWSDKDWQEFAKKNDKKWKKN